MLTIKTMKHLLVASIALSNVSAANAESKELPSDSYTWLESLAKQGNSCFKQAFQDLKEGLCKEMQDEQ